MVKFVSARGHSGGIQAQDQVVILASLVQWSKMLNQYSQGYYCDQH